MRLLFDSNSVQVQVQHQTHTRLNTLLGAIRSAGAALNDPWTVSYSVNRITKKQLAGVDVLVVLTRDPEPGNAYTAHEIETIAGYVHGGGNLLLMTDHPPNPVNDAPLASRFGIKLLPVFVSNPKVRQLALNPMVMSSRCLNRSLADSLLYQVTSLVAHDSCEIDAPPAAVSIATFPRTAIASPNGRPPVNKNFAIALRRGAGNVIVVGNSGFICDYGSPKPACGLAPIGSNLLFFLGCVRYLTGVPTPAYRGLCPGEAVPVRKPAP